MQDLQELEDWIESPFVAGISPWQFFLGYGLLLVVAFMWHLIIRAFVTARSAV